MTPDQARGSLGAEPRGSGHRAGPHDGAGAGSAALEQAGQDVNAGGFRARTAGLFDRLADRYEAWYDRPPGAAIFAAELACLRPLLAGLPRPWAEVGVGSGRFAAALGAEAGVDPAAGLLALAAARGIQVIRGSGERLPFRSGVLGAVLMVVTVCFADDPAALLAEARRVIRDDGAVVLGEVFAESAWWRFYQDKAARGHPFYSAARFLTRDQAVALVTGAGLRVQAAQSTLYQRPTDSPRPESAREGEADAAGFIAWRAVPTGPSLANENWHARTPTRNASKHPCHRLANRER